MTTSNPLPGRAEILKKIRAANGAISDAATAQSEWSALPRDYKRSATQSREAVLNLFEDRLFDYDAQVIRSTAADISRCIAERLSAQGRQTLVVPSGFPAAFLPPTFTFVTDNSLTPAELDTVDGVITASALAIAETGTLVLQNVAGQGRRAATLVPDYHLCLVRADDVVATVPEAIARLQPTASLPTTFVSGPSATADIEMTRIKGVHGPRLLDVIVVV